MDIFESIRLMPADEQAWIQYRMDEEQTMQEDMEKGWKMWDDMHKLSYLAEDAICRNRPVNLIVRFMDEYLDTWQKEYFLSELLKYKGTYSAIEERHICNLDDEISEAFDTAMDMGITWEDMQDVCDMDEGEY